jgi:hypothetical protein
MRSAFILIAWLNYAVLLAALSQQPQQNAVAERAQQQPATDSRGTDASPLVVRVQPAPMTEAEAAVEQRQRDQQASDRNWTQGLAIVTAILGLLQLAAISFQVYIARRQNQIIERQNSIMKGQRSAADAQS